MRLTTTILIGTIAASMVAAPFVSNAQITKQGSKYLLRTKWTKGKVYKYGLKINVEGSGQKQTMNGDITMTVKGVSGKNGTVEVKSTGMQGGSKGTTQTVTFDDRGKVVSGVNMLGSANELPAGPVGIGDSWTTTLPASQQTAGMKGTSKSKLVGVKAVGSRQCAVIAISISLGGGQQGLKGTGTGTTLVDMADGQSVSTNMAMTMTMTPPKGSDGKTPKPMSFKTIMTMSRK